MSFWVLENKKHSYAKIHKSECSCCRGGKGPKAGHTGCWHGPFSTYTEAFAAASNIKRNVDGCRMCKPKYSGKPYS